MATIDGVAGAKVLAGFAMGLLAAYAMPSIEGATSKMTATELAAWVQAIGSIVGIAIAIGVPLYIQRSRDQRQVVADRSRALTLAIKVGPDVALLGPMAGHLASTHENFFGTVSSFLGEQGLVESFLELTPSVLAVADQMEQAGPEAIRLQRAISTLRVFPILMKQGRLASQGLCELHPAYTEKALRGSLKQINADLDAYNSWAIRALWQ